MPKNEIEKFNFPPENTEGILNGQEKKPDNPDTPEKRDVEFKNDGSLSVNDIKDLSSKYSGDKEETDRFADFIMKKFKKSITRRDFLKTAAGAAVGLTIGYAYFKENIDKLWLEFQEERENGYEIEYSEQLTELYEEVKNSPDKEIRHETLGKTLKDVNVLFENAEFIKNSDKKNLEYLANELDEKQLDVLLFGENHGPESNAKNAVAILEKLKKKKISKICLEFLDRKDREKAALTELFNNKKISADEFFKNGNYPSDIRPLLDFAQKNNIPVSGIEDYENYGDEAGFERFLSMSNIVEEEAKNKKENETIAVFTGKFHTDQKNLGETFEYLMNEKPFFKESYDSGQQRNYTMKECLEESGLKPAVINLEDWKYTSSTDNLYVKEKYGRLQNDEEAEIFKNYCQKKWSSYMIGGENVFSVANKNAENTYTIVTPSEVPDISPALNLSGEIRKKYQKLQDILDKEAILSEFGSQEAKIHKSFSGKDIKIAELHEKTGKIKKLFLPEQSKEK